MPIIITAGEEGCLHIYNPDADAKTGRWCSPPEVPDRCYTCIDPETLAHYPAEAFREETDAEGTVRYGICHRCTGRRGADAQTQKSFSEVGEDGQ